MFRRVNSEGTKEVHECQKRLVARQHTIYYFF